MKMLLIASMMTFALASQAEIKYDENLNSEYLKRSESVVDYRLLNTAIAHLAKKKGSLDFESYQVRQPNTVFLKLTNNEICRVFVSSYREVNDLTISDCK